VSVQKHYCTTVWLELTFGFRVSENTFSVQRISDEA